MLLISRSSTGLMTAMVLQDFVGQPHIVRALLTALRQEKLGHAYLFVGPRGIGKRELALRLAQALNCLQPRDGDGCGSCRSCRKIAAGNHPDVTVIEPEGTTIGIDAVRRLRREAAFPPFEGHYKVYILAAAETLTTEAANSLLKILEEPPSRMVLLLLTAHPQALLPTVLSRVQKLSFRPVPQELIMQELQTAGGIAPERAAFYAALAHGNPGEARRLAESASLLEERAAVFELLAKLLESPDELVIFTESQALAAKNRDLTRFLELFMTVVRDVELLTIGMARDQLINRDKQAELERLQAELPPGAAGTLVRLSQEALRALSHRANPLLVSEVFLLQARRVMLGQLQPEEAGLHPGWSGF